MKNARWAALSLMTLATLAVSGCASKTAGDAAVPLVSGTTSASATNATNATTATGATSVMSAPTWKRTELFFSLGDWTETALSTEAESRWLTFLEREVTPRFPDGLTVVDAYGQWHDAKAETKIDRERSRVLVIVHADSPANTAKIEEIRAAWKHLTGNRSVLRVTQAVDVSF